MTSIFNPGTRVLIQQWPFDKGAPMDWRGDIETTPHIGKFGVITNINPISDLKYRVMLDDEKYSYYSEHEVIPVGLPEEDEEDLYI